MTMSHPAMQRYRDELAAIEAQGLFKRERIITSPQSAEITLADGRRVLNFCANNYLGLADHPDIIAAAKHALDTHGFGMASVRFICGTQDLHKQLEARIAAFFGTEDTILYAACFDANGGLFEPLLGEEDAIISDALNHASIIDGVRLCKARRYRYANCDMADLEAQLKQAKVDGARTIMITTDGVFSMDGFIAPLDKITALARDYGALVHIDECHATGFLGASGLREQLVENTRYFRERMTAAGFDLKPGVHPIVPVMIYDAPLAQQMAAQLLDEGIYVTGFFFPVVPKGQARIRTQMSAAHTREHLDRAIDAFTRVAKRIGVLG
jgi:7-keto-8-aminopelargonate synthetase-like enzyme